jgi:hypothetical protein
MSNSNKRIDELIDTLQGLSLDIKTALDALAIARDEENEERNPSARPRKPAVGSGNRGAQIEEAIAEQRILSIKQRLGIVARNRTAVGTGEPNDTNRPFRIGDQILITDIDPKVKHSRRGTVLRITRARVYFRTEDAIKTWRSPKNLTLTFGYGLG